MKYIALLSLVLACGGTAASSPSQPNDSGTPDAFTEPTCASIGAPVNVVASDDLGYPTYAIRGCRMAYVDSKNQNLVLRDLTTGVETTLELAVNKPKRPSIASDVVAWEVTLTNPDYSYQSVRALYGGATHFIDAPPGYGSIGEPAVARGIVVVTAFKTNAFDTDTDVFAFDVASNKLTPVVVAPSQQRFAAVSDGLVAVTDFSEDPNGYFSGSGNDLADIGVFKRAAQTYEVRKHPGKDAFPTIISGDVLGYLHWGDVHPEPKLEAYSLYTARVSASPSTDARVADVVNALRYLRPSASAGSLEWVTTTLNAGSTLWRSNLVASPVIALELKTETMFAPASFETGTLVARNGALVVVAR